MTKYLNYQCFLPLIFLQIIMISIFSRMLCSCKQPTNCKAMIWNASRWYTFHKICLCEALQFITSLMHFQKWLISHTERERMNLQYVIAKIQWSSWTRCCIKQGLNKLESIFQNKGIMKRLLFWSKGCLEERSNLFSLFQNYFLSLSMDAF